MFDPLNAARTKWGDIPPDDQEAFRVIAAEGLMVQAISQSWGLWSDTPRPVYVDAHIYRICPRAMALREIIQTGGCGRANCMMRTVMSEVMK